MCYYQGKECTDRYLTYTILVYIIKGRGAVFMKDFLNKKNIILLCVVFLLLGIYIFLLLFFNNPNGNKGKYLYVGNYLIWEYKNNEFVQLNEVSDKISEADFVVYDGTKKKYASYAQYVNNNWNFLGKGYSDLNIKDYRIAYTGFKNIDLANYKLKGYDVSDDEYISLINNTKNESEFNSFRNSLVKTDVDIDGDEKSETLYTMSSYALSITNYKITSYVFVVDDGKVSIIAKSEGMEPFNIVEILDLDDDGVNEIVIVKGRLNMPSLDDCYQIYEFASGKYQMKQDCVR